MTYLIVGDPHLQHQRLEDAKDFIEKLIAYSNSGSIDRVVLLGDLFHTFAVIRSEVMSLWNYYFSSQSKNKVIAIVGNHDYASQNGGSHALEVFRDKAIIVDSLQCIEDIYFLPFIRDNDEFSRQCSLIPAGRILVCHQSFIGAEFENGFSDPHGVDRGCVAHLNYVISGHIHRNQEIKNIWYPGTPFQHSFGEAGQKKRIYTIEMSSSGYEIVEEHNLDMPDYEVIEAHDILNIKLPPVNPKTSYKIISKGSPAEIMAFWNNPTVKDFKAQAKRLVDGIVPERGQVNLPGGNGKTQKDKLEQFIRDKKWRTSSEQLFSRASNLLFVREMAG